MSVVIKDYRDAVLGGHMFHGTVDEAMLIGDPSGWALVSWDLIADLGWEIAEVYLCRSTPLPYGGPTDGTIEVIPTNRGPNWVFFRFLAMHSQWVLCGNNDPAGIISVYLQDGCYE